MNKITDKNEFIKIVGILSNSDILNEDCVYITSFIVNLNKQLDEKDKVIDEILEHPFFTNECPCTSIDDRDDRISKICDCENC